MDVCVGMRVGLKRMRKGISLDRYDARPSPALILSCV